MKKFIYFISIFFIFTLVLLFSNNSTNTKVISYNGNNLRISVDGEVVDTLPTSGNYYLVSYDCQNNQTKLTWDSENNLLNITNGTKKGNVICYLEFKSKPLLSEMPVGSYVKYVGNNGCVGDACKGYNANYVSDTNMGYCHYSYKFYVNGWRIGYIEDGSAYLISAGAPECMCSNSDGTTSNSSCSSDLSSSDINKHYVNMDNIALKYCNSDYAKGGKCDATTTWAMDATDFRKITGSTLSSSSCYGKYSNMVCGYTNDLIDNGGYYWLATNLSSSSTYSFYWAPNYRFVYVNYSNIVYGARPVLYLESSIIVVGGSGTYEDPYLIANNTFDISNTGNIVNSNGRLVSVVLNMKSASSSISKMCISVGTAACSNYIDFTDTYTLDLTGVPEGENIIYAYYKDDTGKIVASMNRSITIS